MDKELEKMIVEEWKQSLKRTAYNVVIVLGTISIFWVIFN